MKIRILGAVIATLAALWIGTETFAQQRVDLPRAPTVDEQTISVDFAGGSLAEFVAALRRAAGDMAVNILYPTEFAELQIPAIELQQVFLADALRVASYLSQHRPLHMPDGREASWAFDRSSSGPGAPVFMIDVWAEDPDDGDEVARPARQQPRHTSIHTITELTTGTGAMSADDVLSAIQAALAIEGTDDETKMSFHEETGLIFARVTPNEGSVIEQTLMNLGRSMDARRRSMREADDREAQEARTQNLHSQVIMLKSQNAKLQTRIEHLETLLRSRLNGEDAVPENPLGDDPTGRD